ncbi:hypothetical protein AAE478_004469 [Parahypoxylon ruwenzoriense]
MGTIAKVAVAGASGIVGTVVLRQLLDDGFKVTALTRKGGNHAFPSSVTVAEIDYESPETLVKALEGQDAVVSTVGFDGLEQQVPLIQAAAKAGVKRFIPSEYGGDAENEKALELPIFRVKKVVSDALKKEAASGSLTYTLISTGPFLDMGLQYGLLIDLKGKNINLWDGGDRKFSSTSLESAAKAVSGVLKHPEETKNRNVFVRNVSITSKELLEKAKKATGPEGWTSNIVSVDDVLKKAYADFENGKVDRFSFIKGVIWGDGFGGDFEKVDNDLLGVKELDDAGLQAVIESFAK